MSTEKKIKNYFTQCRICNDNKNYNRLSSHINRTHKIEYIDYLIQYEYHDEHPECKCGCEKKVTLNPNKALGFNDYLHGHNAQGHEVTQSTRKKIGKKNSENMKQFYEKNPEAGKKNTSRMNSFKTDESEKKRIEASINAVKNMSKEEKFEKFSVPKIKLWREERKKMLEAQKKAAKTRKENYDNGMYDFTESNKKISETITNKYLNNEFLWCKGTYYSTKMNKNFNYRSSWEKAYMEILDNDDNIIFWDYEPFSIPYKLNEKQKRYIPDFIITLNDNSKKLIEIKPKALTETKINKAKFEAAIKYCEENQITFEIVSNFELPICPL